MRDDEICRPIVRRMADVLPDPVDGRELEATSRGWKPSATRHFANADCSVKAGPTFQSHQAQWSVMFDNSHPVLRACGACASKYAASSAGYISFRSCRAVFCSCRREQKL